MSKTSQRKKQITSTGYQDYKNYGAKQWWWRFKECSDLYHYGFERARKDMHTKYLERLRVRRTFWGWIKYIFSL